MLLPSRPAEPRPPQPLAATRFLVEALAEASLLRHVVARPARLWSDPRGCVVRFLDLLERLERRDRVMQHGS
jgi:hypothetical protein